jgi:hypothetical protein
MTVDLLVAGGSRLTTTPIQQWTDVHIGRGRGSEIESVVNGVPLVDLGDVLALSQYVRAAWQPLIDGVGAPRV